MGLIIGSSFPMFMKGYPTMSDKYDVLGGVLTGSNPAQFGQLVCYSSTTGYYEAYSGTKTTADIAGIVLATNVKLADDYPATTIQVNPGEAFNLLLDGYVAVELASTAVESNIKAGKAVAVTLTGGALTTSGVASTADLDGYVFTGAYEKKGTTIIAEIKVK